MALVLEHDGRVAQSAEASVLSTALEADIAMSVWRRQLDAGVADWLDALPLEELPNQRVTAARSVTPEAVANICACMPDAPERAALIADIADVIERFCEVTSTSHVKIRLNAVADDGCRKFHQDAIAARLLCTYRGPATQWGYANRGETPETVHQLSRADAAILKGMRDWSGLTHRLLHRSPPIEGEGTIRFLLVVDAIDWNAGAEVKLNWAKAGGDRG